MEVVVTLFDRRNGEEFLDQPFETGVLQTPEKNFCNTVLQTRSDDASSRHRGSHYVRLKSFMTLNST